MLLGALLTACATPSLPATPSPFPTFDLSRLPPPGGAPPEVRAYLAEAAPYSDPGVVALAPQFTVDRLDRIVATLEALSPPPAMASAHQALLKGYRSIAQGRRIAVENVGDNQLQAEARSLTDFGQALLQEHLQIVDTYLASLRATPIP